MNTDTWRMEETPCLANQLLIAMPGMTDPGFSNTVTLVCEHTADGALGIVINRPLKLDLRGLFKQLGIRVLTPVGTNEAVVMGGPVSSERGFVLHDGDTEFESSLVISENIRLTLSRDIIEALAAGTGPKKALVALGYAGWDAGQLEDEILSNSWLHAPASADIVFGMPFAQRWSAAAKSVGVDMTRLAPDAGRA